MGFRLHQKSIKYLLNIGCAIVFVTLEVGQAENKKYIQI